MRLGNPSFAMFGLERMYMNHAKIRPIISKGGILATQADQQAGANINASLQAVAWHVCGVDEVNIHAARMLGCSHTFLMGIK
jgi:hypothetical protein